MEEKDVEAFIQACKLGSRIREDSKKLIMVGEPLLDIAENIEQMILDEDARPAFPVNISINEIAAHYTPEFDCTAVLPEKGVVKIDIGVYLDGGISDTAYTIDLDGTHEKLLQASEQALEAAIQTIKPGVATGEVGGAIEDKIRSFGFKPISNLTGHMLLPGELHAGVDVPNIRTNTSYEFKVNDVFAIEPFATDGKGAVSDLEQVEIFSLHMPHQIRMRQSRKILQHVIDNYALMPFAERWVRKSFESKLLVGASLKELLSAQVIKGYPVLKEEGDGMVSQFEHTILVTDQGNKVLTR
jgi:methionyl aminopeptidase